MFLKKIYRIFKKVFPGYTVVPLLSMLALNMLVYFGTRPFTSGLHHYNLSTSLDYAIPFLPVFIIPYVLAFLQWGLGYIVIARDSKKLCYSLCTAEMVAKLLAGLTFILLPTTMVRPEVMGNDIASWLTRVIFLADSPDNLFPSIHCLESIFVCYGAWKAKKCGIAYKISMTTMSVIICLSTVFVKQHVILDFFGALFYALIGLVASTLIFRKRDL